MCLCEHARVNHLVCSLNICLTGLFLFSQLRMHKNAADPERSAVGTGVNRTTNLNFTRTGTFRGSQTGGLCSSLDHDVPMNLQGIVGGLWSS